MLFGFPISSYWFKTAFTGRRRYKVLRLFLLNVNTALASFVTHGQTVSKYPIQLPFTKRGGGGTPPGIEVGYKVLRFFFLETAYSDGTGIGETFLPWKINKIGERCKW